MSTPGTSPSSSRDLTLVVESESGTPEEYFAQVGLCIGRASSNTIVIDHEDLDRIHARIVKQDDAFWLQCEPNAPSLQVLEPEPGEVEKVEIQPGLAITLGGIVIRCRRQFRGMMGEDDDYWANAIGGEKFKEDREGFTGWLPKQVGPYQIRRYVARGGMGIVLQGLHEETAHLAAVKLPTPDLNRDEQWLKRFEQEVQTLKKLVNPYLVRLQDSGKAGDVQWLAMDWVEGSTVGERLQVSKKADKPMPLSEIQLILKQVVEGLQYLHSQNVVHRDLKPGNLLMGQDGSVKVADFGLAKQVGGGQSTFMTQTGTLAGTVDYMAPEQKEGLAVTTAADIYALGIIWHELLTGKRPGGGRLRLQRFRSDSPPSWESIMEDCLDREASERPSLSRIKQALEEEIFEAKPRRQLQGDAGDDAKNIPTPSVDPPSGIPKFNPEKATTEKAATEKATTEKATTEKAAAEKAAAEKAAAEKAAAGTTTSSSRRSGFEKAASKEPARKKPKPHLKSHRGRLILWLGLLSIALGLCTGPFAWFMGKKDLKEMNAGRMDPSGRENTEIGTGWGRIMTMAWIGLFGGLFLVWVALAFK